MKLIFLILLALPTCNANAQPLENGKVKIAGIEYYQDAFNKNIYYYMPGQLQLSRNSNGKPDVTIIKMRQVGSSLYDREDDIHYKSIFQFGLNLIQTDLQTMDIDDAIPLGVNDIEFRPIPISSLEVSIIFPQIKGQKQDTIPGNIENKKSSTIWSSAQATLKLSNVQVQLLENAFRNNTTYISFSYTYYTDFIHFGTEMNKSYHGDTTYVKQEFADTILIEKPFYSDATPINIDLDRFPQLLIEADADASAPPGYPLVEVRNYGFSQRNNTKHVAKKIEFRATGIGGGLVSSSMTYYKNEPDVIVRQLRFQYAIDIKRPLQYRIVKIYDDKPPSYSSWNDHPMWVGILDVTEL